MAVVGRVVRLSRTGSTPSTASPAETSGRLLGSDVEDRRSEYVEGPAEVFPEWTRLRRPLAAWWVAGPATSAKTTATRRRAGWCGQTAVESKGEGHGVTNHSMTHPEPFSRGNSTTIRQQITDAQSAITDAGGVAPKLFRAPGGDWSAVVLSAMQDLQMVALGWDTSTPGTGHGRYRVGQQPAARRATRRHSAVPRRRRQSCANSRVVAHRAASTKGPWPAVRHPVGPPLRSKMLACSPTLAPQRNRSRCDRVALGPQPVGGIAK